MKKLLKSALAFALCLALVAAIVPVSAFAVLGWKTPEPGHDPIMIPGEVSFKLKEPYYQFDVLGPYPDLREIIPELDEIGIEKYIDNVLCVMLANLDTIMERDPGHTFKPYLVSGVGISFHVFMAEKTVEATLKAVELLNANPYVESANPVYAAGWPAVMDPIEDEIPDNYVAPEEDEATVTDALGVLRIAAGLAPATPEAIALYDKDGDGVITVTDALLVLRIAAKFA